MSWQCPGEKACVFDRMKEVELRARIVELESECDNMKRVLCQGQLSMVTTDAAKVDAVLRDVAAAMWGPVEADRLYPVEMNGKRPWVTIVAAPDAVQREVVMQMEKGKAP